MAQKRRKDLEAQEKQRRTTLLCIAGGIGAIVLSLVICLLVFDIGPKHVPVSAPETTALPYSVDDPFTLADLTQEQITQLRAEGRMRVSDGPRGISVGDSLDKLLSRFPTSVGSGQALPEKGGSQSDADMQLYYDQYLDSKTAQNPEQNGLKSNEETVLYCAQYFQNQNGLMTALPPRGLLTVDTGAIVVTLLSPTTPYPIGVLDDYRMYEHVSCVFTISPKTMTVESIVLGLNR